MAEVIVWAAFAVADDEGELTEVRLNRPDGTHYTDLDEALQAVEQSKWIRASANRRLVRCSAIVSLRLGEW